MLFLSQPGSALPRLSFEQLRDAGLHAAEQGRLDEALELCDKALAAARQRDDQVLIDLATCNRSATLISLARYEDAVSPLRQILMRSNDAKVCAIAAYNLSRVHEAIAEYKKGLFYGRIARDRALAVGRDDLLMGSYNQIANCLTADSFFAEATEEYHKALALLPEGRSVERALGMVNLGYCLMMQGQTREGMSLSLRALRWLRGFGARVYEAWPQLDLCYAYLDLERPDRARQHGQLALRLADEVGETACFKNALFLLGETERAAGDLEAAYEYFSQLQQSFYQDSPQIVELMVQVGLRQVVNLRA